MGWSRRWRRITTCDPSLSWWSVRTVGTLLLLVVVACGPNEPNTGGIRLGVEPTSGIAPPTTPDSEQPIPEVPSPPDDSIAWTTDCPVTPLAPDVLPKNTETVQRPEPLAQDAAPWTSGRAMALRGDRLVVADTRANSLVIIDRTSGHTALRIPVGRRPEQVVIGPNGTTYATVRGDAQVVAVDINGEITHRIDSGLQPFGLALNTDGTRLYVTDMALGTLTMFDTDTMEVLESIGGFHEPRGVAYQEKEGFLVVADKSRFARPFRAQRLYWKDSDATQFEMPLPVDLDGLDDGISVFANRATSAVALPHRARALLAYHQARPGIPLNVASKVVEEITGGSLSTGYGGSASHGHLEANPRPVEMRVTEVNIDELRGGDAADSSDPPFVRRVRRLAHQPRDINHHPNRTMAFVVGHTTDTVLILNTADDDPYRAPLGLLHTGRAPKAIVFSEDGFFAYTLDSLSYTVSEIPLTSGPNLLKSDSSVMELAEIFPSRCSTFGTDTRPAIVRKGHDLFTRATNPDLSIGFDFACDTCHMDGGQDDLVWFIADGPRQTPELRGRLAGTAPYNWSGSEPTLGDNIARTVARMGGAGLPDEDIEHLVAYLLSLSAAINPVATRPMDTSAYRGATLFHNTYVGCKTCHVDGRGTDNLAHDVGTTSAIEWSVLESAASYNTPSLRNVGLTAPYFHDGSAATLYEVLEQTSGHMGNTEHLTSAQIDDLVAYLLRL